MTDDVRDSYDAMAERYAELFIDDLSGNAYARDWIEALAGRAATRRGVVADLGCGPGHVVHLLSGLGLEAVGYDLSPGQIEQARKAFPGSSFHVGDFASLDLPDSSLGGIVSRYSIIHTRPDRLDGIFREWLRLLEPGAPLLVTFFASRSADAHGTPFDHKVVTAHELFPETIGRQLGNAGFVDIEVSAVPPPEGGRPLDQGTVLAATPTS